jgi:hypothetical protein
MERRKSVAGGSRDEHDGEDLDTVTRTVIPFLPPPHLKDRIGDQRVGE